MTLKLAAIAVAIVTIAGVKPCVAQEKSSISELKAIAEEAYLYCFPMVVGYDVLYKFFIDRNSGQFKAPINQINNEARVFTPKDTAISTPNSDTPYSMALLDLRAEPMVLCMPEIEKARYYDVQLVNLYTDNYTMYDGRTQLLIDNPINRYLINSPMLPELKKNRDGSITLYIQKDSPGKDRESNWLPAPDGPMFVVMRMYWPKTTKPSVYPLGKGSWKPPALVPVRNLNSLDVKRFGDKSLENFIRTDTRYGHDGLFKGPRGWGYWNYLEYPKPIQNPNLWPDMQSTYFIGTLALPEGAVLTLNYTYPHARYFQFALYKQEHGTFVSIGEDLSGPQIEPDPGSTNPFRVGANRLADKRNFTLRILADDAPKNKKQRTANTLYVGKNGGELMFVSRTYLSDQGSDGAGWGPADTPDRGLGLPTYTGTLKDGAKLSAAEVVKQFGRPMPAPKSPVTAQQWDMLVNAKDNDPALDPATAPARKEPKWEKYWNIRYSILGAFKTPQERAKIPYASAIDGGGDPETEYMFVQLSRKFGPVYVMSSKMPTFPDTYAGSGGKGLEIMPAAQNQYWSIVSCEAMPSGQIVDALTDMQVPLDKDGNYTIVYSRKEDRPANATAENGVAWIEWSPRGEVSTGRRTAPTSAS
jgi:hypothetical protein